MYSAFQSIRRMIQAFLIVALVVFGHRFALIASSRHLILQAPPDFEVPLNQVSALLAASTLWVTFTLLELVDIMENPDGRNDADLPDNEDGESLRTRKALPVVSSIKAESEAFAEGYKDLCLCFCRTEVELGFGLALLTAWTVYWKEALFVIFIPLRVGNRDLALLACGYVLIILGLAALSGQTLLSLTCHLVTNGFDTLGRDIWGSRTGSWTSRRSVRLCEESTILGKGVDRA